MCKKHFPILTLVLILLLFLSVFIVVFSNNVKGYTCKLSIIIYPVNGGTVKCIPEGTWDDTRPPGWIYTVGTQVTVTANAKSGYEFDKWSGDASGTDSSIVVIMDSNKRITATFKQTSIEYTLTTNVQPPGSGSISLNPSGGVYDKGTTVTATASAFSGYVFSHWSGDTSGSNPVTTVTMSSNKNIIANFIAESEQYILTTSVQPPGSGSIKLDPSGGVYDEGTVVKITASPIYIGYEFDHWSGDASGANPTIEITMNSDKSITAYFVEETEKPKKYILTTSVSPTGGGYLELDPSGGIYSEGTTVTVTAYANSGYIFDCWSIDPFNPNPEIEVIMDSDITITAYFIETNGQQQYFLTTSVSPTGGGYLELDPSGGIYSEGTTVTVTAYANSGYIFDCWSIDPFNTNPEINITMNSDMNITVYFIETNGQQQYLLTTSVSPTGAGYLVLDPPGGIYGKGVVITVNVNVSEGYRFDHWGGAASGINTTVQITMDSDKAIIAFFEKTGDGSVPATSTDAPGFEMIIVICAIALVLFQIKKRKINKKL